ncbi:hypothetical protein EHW99_0535 [Erwinia amylovora]|uniref:Uncharacterized protein n=2 Tax=Erwinia amylovora TaxID=552 RepID=A0A831A3R0_ERWAM|nr:hypothetical protein EaACW_3099 [Erwinia amylovora ACW56400]QJQ53242.1 hypothetical protein EHX00_0535 [Erwinia amylovora]CBA22967.1 hypothetical protein predicted by Glimmer/Critica [Erwinia amylovora CFBP1430]CCO79938.1 hypothetical protein BN432_3164 [Erwinia amylovora Ea356]CCO83743.1 hypothetical protein BN433_3190 [Erwinia amylovora Ea266]CCO87504.1 hypothetical protein BN434_3139 [Erwinia amylovora CFBP 2585]CCO91298.1 hypothetical protein BN435_3150 [Erwinia amylovora 01SFR-BO]CCO
MVNEAAVNGLLEVNKPAMETEAVRASQVATVG